jgi:hypothetical protein
MSILVVFALVAGCFAVVAPAIADAGYNENQDFEGTPVIVTASAESVYVDEEAQITISVENIADRGLPDVSIWVNNVRVAFYSDIGKGKIVAFTYDVDTSVADTFEFAIEVWTRLDNKNFEALLLGDETITITVVEPEPTGRTPEQWRDAIRDAITTALDGNTDIRTLVEDILGGKGTQITVTIDGKPYVFTSNGDANSDKSLIIEGRTYIINIKGNSGNWAVL